MEIEINDYPLLAENYDLVSCINDIQKAEENIIQDKSLLKIKIQSIQSRHKHKKYKLVTIDDSFSDKKILDKKICVDCGYSEVRPEDTNNKKFCDVCWNEMANVCGNDDDVDDKHDVMINGMHR